MAVRIKIIPNADDIAEMRKNLSEEPEDDAQKLKLFDEFFSGFEAKLAMVNFKNTKYCLYDAVYFNLFIDFVMDQKKILNEQLNTEHHLMPDDRNNVEDDFMHWVWMIKHS